MTENVMHHPGFKRRTDIHLARKIWHMTTVFAMFLCWTIMPTAVSVGILIVCWLAFVPVDFMRQKSPALNDWLLHAFKSIMRENEVNRLAGTTYLLTGVAVVVAIFPRPIVSLTLLFLAFADPIASYVGIRHGRDKIWGNKSLQGTIAAYVVCVIASIVYVFSLNHSIDRVIVFSLVAGAVGALAELVPLGKMDDNFTLPVLSAVGLSALFFFFGFFPGAL